jgi:hypothetical protein
VSQSTLTVSVNHFSSSQIERSGRNDDESKKIAIGKIGKSSNKHSEMMIGKYSNQELAGMAFDTRKMTKTQLGK